MGAGKSHTVRWMWEAGHFPLEAIVHLDPDLFKTAMPEWDGYVALDPMSAGQRTQRESGYLVEIAQAAAMAERRRVSADLAHLLRVPILSTHSVGSGRER